MLRVETKARARALQILYAWELQDRPPMRQVVDRLAQLCRVRGREFDGAEALADAVARDAAVLDEEIAGAAVHWRLPRIGMVERNILRIGVHELGASGTPGRVVISEALRLAHWFAGPRAAPFVNGVLDALARQRGRL